MIAEIESLSLAGVERLSYKQRNLLLQQMTLINLLGSEKKIVGAKGKEYSCAAELSITEMRELITYYQQLVTNSKNPDAEREVGRLVLITLEREAMYRTWGNMPNSTQVLSILHRRMVGAHAFTQLIAGEGKSVTLALDAALEALE
ncbi:MAG: hypothetical protein ACRCXC_06015 [Legionella sp.]